MTTKFAASSNSSDVPPAATYDDDKVEDDDEEENELNSNGDIDEDDDNWDSLSVELPAVDVEQDDEQTAAAPLREQRHSAGGGGATANRFDYTSPPPIHITRTSPIPPQLLQQSNGRDASYYQQQISPSTASTFEGINANTYLKVTIKRKNNFTLARNQKNDLHI